ncbi:hypothetical protein Hanom_Chr01g00023171 [Helianthus anomalus]
MNGSPNDILSLSHVGSVIHPSLPVVKVTLLLTINTNKHIILPKITKQKYNKNK